VRLALRKPAIAVDVAPADGGLRVKLETDTLARHVRLAYDADDGTFSDNYFDLVPGRPVEVTYWPKGPVEAEAFRKGLAVVSILDAESSSR
jgi:beta-mannosidase